MQACPLGSLLAGINKSLRLPCFPEEKSLKTGCKADTIGKGVPTIVQNGGEVLGKKVTVIGGGASGMVAAIAAARQGAEVTIVEHMDRVGRKLLSTGNGRCNLTNLSLTEKCYHCSQNGFPMKVLNRFGVQDTLAFFGELGLMTKSKNGYIYPNSEQAAAVLDLLRLELEHQKVCVLLSSEIRQPIQKKRGHFLVRTGKEDIGSDALILAAGSRAAPVTGSDGSGYQLARKLGHRILTPLPALVQLCCSGKYFKQLAGVRCEARVTLCSEGRKLAADTGELQLTDYGISGIPTFQVSRFASQKLAEGRSVLAVLDFMPAMSRTDVQVFLKHRAALLQERKCKDFLTGVFHKKLASVLLRLSGIPEEQSVGKVAEASWEQLLDRIKGFETAVTATNSFEQAQVCCGGADTREVAPETLESRLVPGLYLVGELLDVDGICGGYNLQWAWSTGYLAGTHAGREAI